MSLVLQVELEIVELDPIAQEEQGRLDVHN